MEPTMGDLWPLGDAAYEVVRRLPPSARLSLAAADRASRELVREVDEATPLFAQRAHLPGGAPVRPDSFPVPAGARAIALVGGGSLVAAVGFSMDGWEAWIAVAATRDLAFGAPLEIRHAMAGCRYASIAEAAGRLRVLLSQSDPADEVPLDPGDGQNGWEVWEVPLSGGSSLGLPARTLRGRGACAMSASGDVAWTDPTGYVRTERPAAAFPMDPFRYEYGLLAWNARGTRLLALLCAIDESEHRQAYVLDPSAGSIAPLGIAQDWTALKVTASTLPIAAPPVAGGWILSGTAPQNRRRARFHAREDGHVDPLPEPVDRALALARHVSLGTRLLVPAETRGAGLRAVRFGDPGTAPSLRDLDPLLPAGYAADLLWAYAGGGNALVAHAARRPLDLFGTPTTGTPNGYIVYSTGFL